MIIRVVLANILMVGVMGCLTSGVGDQQEAEIPDDLYTRGTVVDVSEINPAIEKIRDNFQDSDFLPLKPSAPSDSDHVPILVTEPASIEYDVPTIASDVVRSDIYVIDSVFNPVTAEMNVTNIGWRFINDSSGSIAMVDAIMFKENGHIVARLDRDSHGYILGPGTSYNLSITPLVQIDTEDLNWLVVDWLIKDESQELARLRITPTLSESKSSLAGSSELVVNSDQDATPLLGSFSVRMQPEATDNKQVSQVRWLLRNDSKESASIQEIWITSNTDQNLGHIVGPFDVDAGGEFSFGDALSKPVQNDHLLGLQSEWVIEFDNGHRLFCRSAGSQDTLCDWMQDISAIVIVGPTPTPLPSLCSQNLNIGPGSVNPIKHIFWGTAQGAKITAWIGTRKVAETETGGKDRSTASPYSIIIDLCDQNGSSKVGQRLHFKLDGYWAKQSELLQESGKTNLSLRTQLQELSQNIQSSRDSYDKLASLFNQRGSIYFDRGNYQAARIDFDTAVKHNSQTALYYYNRSRAYRAIGRQSKAVLDSKQACVLDSKYC